ncbi:myozenin-2a isoform X2 [Vanacampus margaritifer]
MSLFSTMTPGERKFQAAAICREIQGLEDVEVDLGKKVSVPQDIMLEELSLVSNRASRLFKMRQQRADKYTFENVPDDVKSHLNNTTDSRADNVNSTEERDSAEKDSGVDRACATQTVTVPDPHSIAPGYGGPLKDVPPEKFNSTAIPKSYHSPWDRAHAREATPVNALVACLPEPEPPADLPGYKSFNRVAIPFGGFAEAPAAVRSMKAELAVPDFPELRGRPCFNRAAQGWNSMGAPIPVHAVTPEATLAPESDDL